jgi:uncharacterized membrane protein YeaQ/YmgE (transglycosylase-associated protein family)
VAGANERFEGGNPTLSSSFSKAMTRFGSIVGWTATNATVGVILSAVREKAGFLGDIVVGIIGAAWNIVTWLVMPVIIVEGIHVLSDLTFIDLFDLTVFVDAPADLRLIRRIRRDEAERGRSAESVIQQYLRFVRPAQTRFIDPARHYCDIVVACEAAPPNRLAPPDADSVDRLVAPVWVQLQKLGVVT